MNRQLKTTKSKFAPLKKSCTIICIALISMLFINTTSAQTEPTTITQNKQLSIKGTVSDDDGYLEGVSVIKKGTVLGTATDKNGAFTFPKTLKAGDILLFSYLGYEEVEVEITKSTTDIKLILSQDVIEMMGALQTNKPFKSKRSN